MPPRSGKFAVLSLDVEDWYHLDYFRTHQCDRRYSLLDGVDNYAKLLSDHGLPSSIFVLGELAGGLRNTLAALSTAGHEVASHGWDHARPLTLTPAEFDDDLRRSKAALEDALAMPVQGYRAPCFSLDRARLEQVRSAGFVYDSSRIQLRDHPLFGSIDLTGYVPVSRDIFRAGEFFEFEVSSLPVGRRALPVSGGGALRLLPWWLARRLVSRYVGGSELYVLYVHPFELSRRPVPPLPSGVPLHTRLRFSVGRANVERRLTGVIAILRAHGFTFTTFAALRRQLLAARPDHGS